MATVSSVAAHPHATTFLGLPVELRMRTYDFLFPTDESLTIVLDPLNKDYISSYTSTRLRILLTCRLIHRECRGLAYRRSVWHIVGTSQSAIYDRLSNYGPFGARFDTRLLSHISPSSLALITRLTLCEAAERGIFSRTEAELAEIGKALPAVTHVYCTQKISMLRSPDCFRHLRVLAIWYGSPQVDVFLLAFFARNFSGLATAKVESAGWAVKIDRGRICLEERIGESDERKMVYGEKKHIHIYFGWWRWSADVNDSKKWLGEQTTRRWVNKCPF